MFLFVLPQISFFFFFNSLVNTLICLDDHVLHDGLELNIWDDDDFFFLFTGVFSFMISNVYYLFFVKLFVSLAICP